MVQPTVHQVALQALRENLPPHVYRAINSSSADFSASSAAAARGAMASIFSGAGSAASHSAVPP